MKKIPLEILGLSPSQSENSNSFAMILSEIGGTRRLPIIIGIFEAQAIAVEIEKIRTHRPMTHDLFKSFTQAFGVHIDEIVISDIREGVFYSKIIGRTSSGEIVSIDARPSDAIAIALRLNVNMFADLELLNKAGISVEEPAPKREKSVSETKESSQELSLKEKMKRMSVGDLKELLNELIAREDYEGAAKVRDEMRKRN